MTHEAPAPALIEAPIRVAVIGLGRAGWDLHTAEIKDDPRYQITDVTDPCPERRDEAEKVLGCQAHATFDALLAEARGDLMIIASPSSVHARQAIDASRAGWHLVVEKPMAITVEEADEMIAAAHQAGRHLLPYQRRRFFPEFTFLQNVLERGVLGDCFHIGFCTHSYVCRNDWQALLKYGGGQLNNTGSHFLDLVLMMLDGPTKDIFCDMKRVCAVGDAEDHFRLFLRTESGMTADLDVSGGAATTRQAPMWTLLGTRGALTVDQGEAVLKYYDPSAAPVIGLQEGLAAEGREYIIDSGLPWHEEKCAAIGPDVGQFYDGVYDTLCKGKAFRVKPEEVREMIRILEICRTQNPTFAISTPASDTEE
jgi:predicted dehydrogenase